MKKLFYLAILCWLMPLATPASAQPVSPAVEAARAQITRKAPIVFVGRPLQAEFYKDAMGRIYKSTVLQILEVLRGEILLKPGTVELVERMEQSSDLEERFRLGATSVYDQDYGVYFAEQSINPNKKVPYQTQNTPLVLQPQGNDWEAQVTVRFGDDGYIIQGLYRMPWASEEAMLSYINGLPGIKPKARLVTEKRYPVFRFRDKRDGGKDIYAPEVSQDPAQVGGSPIKAGVVTRKIDPKEHQVKATVLPLEAFKQLPAIMSRIRTHEPLSKTDSVFIKRYIPEQMPSGQQQKKQTEPGRKVKKTSSKGLGLSPTGHARLTGNDTTLFLAVRNLSVERVNPCERAYQGEVWLKANQSGLYMGQLYFEMSTTSDLKLENSPFGQTLIGTYTPLAGAPGYTFYQSYDAPTKKVLVACYPDWMNPQRVELATISAQPFFRFQYSVDEQNIAAQLPTVNFTPLATSASQSYSNYYLSPIPYYEQGRSFTTLIAEGNATIKRAMPLRINSLSTPNGLLTTAGTGVVLTIHGTNFGLFANPADTTQKSRIQFISADTVAGNFLRDVDRSDVIFWRDTLIQVQIASAGVGAGGRVRSIGGGTIKISTYCGQESQSADTLDIQYNLANSPKNRGKKPIYLVSRDCSRGLTFSLDSALAAVPGAKPAIRAVLRSWSDQLGVSLVLANATIPNATAVEDGKNVIFLNPRIGAMQTSSISAPRPSTTSSDTQVKDRWAALEMDIAISSSLNWSYDTTGIALCSPGTTCQQDFYAAFLHEIGHVLGLKHVVDPNDIMYYILSNTVRRNISTGRKAAVAGVTKLITTSRGITWTNAALSPIGQLLASCSTQNRINPVVPFESPINRQQFVLFPNPVSDESEIVRADSDRGPWEYWIRDVQGRIVFHAEGADSTPIKIGKGLPAGFYTIQLRTAQKTSALKMLKGL